MARTNRLDTIPGLRESIAELAVDGHTQAQIAEKLGEHYPALDGLHPGQVKRWLKDAQVQALIERFGRERTNMIHRTIDATLFARISDPQKRKEMDTRTLLDIRREILPPPAQRHILTRGADEGAAAAELYEKLSDNPDIAAALGVGTLPELEEGDDYDEEVEDDGGRDPESD